MPKPEKLDQAIKKDDAPIESTSSKSNEHPEFTLSSFLISPKTDYTNLIQRINKDSNLESWHEDELFTSFSRTMVFELLHIPKHDYTDMWGNKVKKEDREKEFALLKEKVRGKILVDLGAGADWSMEQLAEILGASVYIQVDKFALAPNLKDSNETVKTEKGMQLVGVRSDMLDFLSRLPDNSVCITINGIDSNIIENKEYHEALIKEISRVLAVNGVAFGTHSTSLDIADKILKQIQVPVKIVEISKRRNAPVILEKSPTQIQQ